MKKPMRDTHAIFGGDLYGRFYYEESFYADSAMITLVHVLNAVGEQDKPLSELMSPLRRYHRSGEVHFQVAAKEAKMEELARRYSQGQADSLDGVTIGFKEWWFNCRPSDTEMLLSLHVEAKTKELLDERLGEITEQLGAPV